MKCAMSIMGLPRHGGWWEKRNIEIMTLFGVMETKIIIHGNKPGKISAEKQSEDCHKSSFPVWVQKGIVRKFSPATVFILKQNAFLEAFL